MHNPPVLAAFDPVWSRRVGRPRALNDAVRVPESSGSHAHVSAVPPADLQDGDDLASESILSESYEEACVRGASHFYAAQTGRLCSQKPWPDNRRGFLHVLSVTRVGALGSCRHDVLRLCEKLAIWANWGAFGAKASKFLSRWCRERMRLFRGRPGAFLPGPVSSPMAPLDRPGNVAKHRRCMADLSVRETGDLAQSSRPKSVNTCRWHRPRHGELTRRWASPSRVLLARSSTWRLRLANASGHGAVAVPRETASYLRRPFRLPCCLPRRPVCTVEFLALH